MSNYLITGIAGAGKSSICYILAAHGYKIIDTDLDRQNKWLDSTTLEPTPYARGEGYKKLAGLVIHWDRSMVLPKILSGLDTQTSQFLCGYTENLNEYYQYFEKMFVVIVDKETVTERLLNRTNGDWGKYPPEMKHALTHVESFLYQLITDGAIPIDGREPPNKSAEFILGAIWKN